MKTGIRLLGEDFQHVKWIEPRERLTLLSEGVAEKVYRDTFGNLSVDSSVGHTDGTIKIRTTAPDTDGLPSLGDYSPASLTAADTFRNAAGSVDSRKRSIIFKLREASDDPKAVPAAIRTYGRDPAIEKGALGKQNPMLLGNAVDRSMSRVEQFGVASETNRAVTIVPGAVLGLTYRDVDTTVSFVL
jgi:hypothetical protein